MRLNPIRVAQDWSHKKKMKAHLLEAVKNQRAGGTGVDVPDDDPLWAIAVEELLKEHPQTLTAVRSQSRIMLCKTGNFNVSADLKNSMNGIGAILHPGDKL
jgi:hypothetical protein